MQLSIFDNLESIKNPDDIITEKANNLLEQLNDGRKKKEFYIPHYYWQENGNIVLMAVNSEKDIMFNIIDGTTGKTPDGFSACWRNLQHIKKELTQNQIK